MTTPITDLREKVAKALVLIALLTTVGCEKLPDCRPGDIYVQPRNPWRQPACVKVQPPAEKADV